jgi:hypothetical protein
MPVQCDVLQPTKAPSSDNDVQETGAEVAALDDVMQVEVEVEVEVQNEDATTVGVDRAVEVEVGAGAEKEQAEETDRQDLAMVTHQVDRRMIGTLESDAEAEVTADRQRDATTATDQANCAPIVETLQ